MTKIDDVMSKLQRSYIDFDDFSLLEHYIIVEFEMILIIQSFIEKWSNRIRFIGRFIRIITQSA